jgi:Fe-S-cluster containining protein
MAMRDREPGDHTAMQAPSESRVEPGQARASLTFAEALRPPCQDCDARCCSYLPLQVVPMRSLMEVDYVRYLLGFPHLQAGFGVNGQWSIYYTVPCRHFEAGARRCRVHGSWEQPRTCVAYNEHDCWYRRAITPESQGFILFDHDRFEALLPQLAFDDDRSLTSVPSWNEMTELCARVALTAALGDVSQGVAPAPASVPDSPAREHPGRGLSDLMEDPCDGCEAPCCRFLYFPLAVPQSFMQLDYTRFCLNFPGVECAVGPTTWWLLVEAPCRFLQAGPRRCAIYGRPERPLRCAHLNQWDCGQYRQLLDPRPATLLRLDREAFAAVCAQMRFDDEGRITSGPELFQQ